MNIVKILADYPVGKTIYIRSSLIESVAGPYQRTDLLASPDVQNYYSSIWWVDIVPKNLKENEYCRKILISESQYKKMIQYIENSFQLNTTNKIQRVGTHSY